MSYNIQIFPFSLEPLLRATLTAGEGKQREEVEEDELENVNDHPRERHLQGPQVGVDAEDVHQLERAAKGR